MKAVSSRRINAVLALVSGLCFPYQSVVAFSAFNSDKDGIAVRESTATQHGPPTIAAIDLGLDKHVKMFVPPDSRQLSRNGEKGTRMTTKDGGGDVIWPSGLALSRLIAHCPALVDHRNVMELGCGLGLVSLAVAKYSRPNHLALSDRDRSVLSLAYASCTQLQRSRASISRCTLDWSDPTTWPAQDYDVVLAADVLYEKSSVLPLVQVLRHYLATDSSDGKMKRAIIVDPANQVNRDAFCYAAFKSGLDVDQEEFQGASDLVLLNVSPLFV
jgi:predicted nicotinamide N-methyase